MTTPTPPSRVPLRGAVDLAAVAAAREAQAAAEQRLASGDVPPASGVVVDVTEATFQTEVLDRSFQVPVVVDLGSPRAQPSAVLTPTLSALATEHAGTWVHARVDVDTSPRIAQDFGVQAIPSVFAVLKGQPMELFQGALPEPQLRELVAELMRVAAANGVTGRVEGLEGEGAADAEPEPEGDPRFDAAYDAIEAGDWDAAEAAYQAVLNQTPADPEAKAGLAQVALLRRTDGADAATALAAADAAPDSLDAQALAADIELLTGRVDEAFARLVALVARTSGDERTAARDHLLGLFLLVGDTDPRVGKARTALANALF